MVDKLKLMAERDNLRRKATMMIWDKPSAYEEIQKIMFRLNYIKGALFALEVQDE